MLSTAPLLVPAPVSVMAAWAVIGQEVHCAMLPLTGAEPHNCCGGLQWADWSCWFAAEQQELAVLEQLKCWEYVPQSAVPVGQRVYRNQFVYKCKPDCHKAHLVFLGNTQKESDYAEMNAPGCKLQEHPDVMQ